MVTMPVPKGFYVTSRFGPRWGAIHYGTDFGNGGGSGGKPVFAVKDGTVTRSGPASGFGRCVTIDHPASNGGGETVYGHIVPEVKVGQKVREGQRIAHIDPNPATNGGVAPHLHMEWHRYSWAPPGPNRLDPETMLRGAKWPGENTPRTGSTTVKAKDIFDIDWSRKFWENGSHTPKIQVVLHTTENGANTTAENVANFQLGPQNTWKGAYHGLVDSRGVALRCNTDDQKVPAAGNASNTHGLHLSLVGYASWTREQWLEQEKMLRRAARVVADWSKKHGIPARQLTAKQVAAKKWGITDHNGTRLAYGGTTHTDVGPGFPWDVFMSYVDENLNGENQAPEIKEDKVTFKQFTDFIKGYFGPQIDALQEVWRQLRGPQGQGWPQLGQNDQGQNLTLVDAVAAVRHDIAALSRKIDQLGGK